MFISRRKLIGGIVGSIYVGVSGCLQNESGTDTDEEAVTAVRDSGTEITSSSTMNHTSSKTDGSDTTLTSEEDLPTVSFGFEGEPGGRFTISHTGGDSVNAYHTYVIYYTSGDREYIRKRWGKEGTTIETGDSLRTSNPVDAGSIIKISRWFEAQSEWKELDRYSVGETYTTRKQAPLVRLEFSGSPGERYTIQHSGGDSFISNSVEIEYVSASDEERTERWGEGSTLVEPGSTTSTTQPVQYDTIIRVFWNPNSNEKSSKIGSHTVE